MKTIYQLTQMDWKDWAITVALSGSSLFVIAYSVFIYLKV